MENVKMTVNDNLEITLHAHKDPALQRHSQVQQSGLGVIYRYIINYIQN